MYRVFFAGKKIYKADLKYSNFHSNYWQTGGKKVPFKVKQFFFFLQTSKISINRHFYLVTRHASYSKTQHQSPIQYKADVSSEERENQKDPEQINKKVSSEILYKTSSNINVQNITKNLCSLNCCYKYTSLSKFFVISVQYLNTNAQKWSLLFLRSGGGENQKVNCKGEVLNCVSK